MSVSPTAKLYKRQTWHLDMTEQQVLLIDAEEQVIAAISRHGGRARLVFPSFWQSIKNLGILADDGQVHWFQAEKATIKKLKRYVVT
jgi:hypothetical protein